MKLDELEAIKSDGDHVFDEATLASLLVDLQEFFKVKTSAHQALEQLKKMTQESQSIDEFLHDWQLKRREAAVDEYYAMELLQQAVKYEIFREMTLRFRKPTMLTKLVDNLRSVGWDFEKIHLIRGAKPQFVPR